MERYPVIIGGEARGELRVTLNGLFTVFELETDRAEGVVRFSVYGGGREGPLGVAAPRGGKLYLRRRLSAAQLRDFPQTIDYAAPSGEPAEKKEEPASPPQSASQPAPQPEETEDDLLWFSTPEGVLTAFDGRQSLIAVPSDAPGAPRGIRRVIGGREYVVFPGYPGRK